MSAYKPMHPLKRLRWIRRECQQFIVDMEWWNENRTDCEPMDCEPERIMLAKAEACIAAWGTPRYAALSADLVAYATMVQQETRTET